MDTCQGFSWRIWHDIRATIKSSWGGPAMTRRLDAFTPELKAYIVRRHLLERVPAAELAREYKIRPAQIEAWVGHVLAQAHRAFEHPPAQRKAKGKRIRLTEWGDSFLDRRALPSRSTATTFKSRLRNTALRPSHVPCCEFRPSAVGRSNTMLSQPGASGRLSGNHRRETS